MTELEDSSDGPCADAVLDRDLPAPAPATHAEDDSPAWAKAGALRRVLLSNSLGPVMGGIFLLSWLAQSVPGSVRSTSGS